MPLLFSKGGEDVELSKEDLKRGLEEAFSKLGPKRNVLIVPPDFTRFHSRAGMLTQLSHEYYKEAVKDILPALGTHKPMTSEEIRKMFGDVPEDLFRIHDWRNDVETIGYVDQDLVRHASDGHMDEPWPAQVNKLVWSGGHDLILSIGQVVPHEVVGMANYNKNLLIGTGGPEAINLSHFVGAAYGMERMMGRADNPLRQIFREATERYLSQRPIVYVLTVVGRRESDGELVTRGLFVGQDEDAYQQAAALSIKVNFTLLKEPVEKMIVYLSPEEYHSTWLGNKSIYRTRMAIKDGGELIVIAPGVSTFGEDAKIDKLIREFGYRTTPETMAALKRSSTLSSELSAAAHLIHGSSEGRFKVYYAAPKLGKEQVESVGFLYADMEEVLQKYPIKSLKEGWNVQSDGERFYYISNPALGLWAHKDRMQS